MRLFGKNKKEGILRIDLRRVLGLILVYDPHRGEYSQWLWLGVV